MSDPPPIPTSAYSVRILAVHGDTATIRVVIRWWTLAWWAWAWTCTCAAIRQAREECGDERPAAIWFPWALVAWVRIATSPIGARW